MLGPDVLTGTHTTEFVAPFLCSNLLFSVAAIRLVGDAAGRRYSRAVIQRGGKRGSGTAVRRYSVAEIRLAAIQRGGNSVVQRFGGAASDTERRYGGRRYSGAEIQLAVVRRDTARRLFSGQRGRGTAGQR